MSRGRIVGIGAYVTVVLVLGVAVWWLISAYEGHDPLVDEALAGADGQRERVETPTSLDVEDGEPEEPDEGIAGVVRGWLRGLSAIATLLSVLGWLVGLVSRHVGGRT